VAPADVRAAAPAGDDPAAALLDRVAHHADEHVIKFSDTAVEVYERTGDPAALAAAVHCANLIESPTA
jgi:hypothetical protein